MKPLASSADIPHPSSKHIPTVTSDILGPATIVSSTTPQEGKV